MNSIVFQYPESLWVLPIALAVLLLLRAVRRRPFAAFPLAALLAPARFRASRLRHIPTFVAAAGNQGTDNDTSPYYPASYPDANVVSVAATDPGDYVAFAFDRVEDGEWQNPEYLAGRESRGKTVRISAGTAASVELRALTE